MAQPDRRQIHVDRPLTTISVAYIQNQSEYIAGRVFPTVPVEKQSDLYYIYDKNDWFRDEAAVRGPAQESAGGGYNVSNDSYSCLEYAFHHDIPWQDLSNADEGIDLERDATEFVTQRLLLRRERQWAANYFTTSKWGTDIAGVSSSPSAGTSVIHWSDYTNGTPVDDVDAARRAIKVATGMTPNRMVLGYDVFNKLKRHPTVRDYYKYVSADVITPQMLAAVFEIEQVMVAGAVYATNVEGETGAYNFVHGKNALLCYAAPRPSKMLPSAGYLFGWTGVSQGMGVEVAIEKFDIRSTKVTRIEGTLAFDHKKVAADLGYFFSGVVA
jgi:hypothetical protein